ncbi:divergent polysaccharide deacetylase family protein [Gorillibacterium massiliense]|uniref:divergent polysaccharide deacetylase family protein n=1 Tax=Gorillibacterium massiliense TaxID=1280390 RepID=UPI0012DC09B0|nr:divergent polysaccharide deacetylase family protein [Gorillibacterium massiliense]
MLSAISAGVVPLGNIQAAADPSRLASHRIAIVIDDLGNGMQGTQDMLNLPIPLTVAIMPFLPTSKQDAEAAFKKGHEVLVHMPMEPFHGKKSWLGPGAITTDLTDDEIRKRVEGAIANVPHAIGINNHMGSKATSDPRVMAVIMQVCREKGLFFLDSKTTPTSKAPEESTRAGVPLLQNGLFLDDVYTHAHVSKQIRLLFEKSRKEADLIVIGHVGVPGKITSSALREAIPALQKEAEFVHLSDMLPWPQPIPR